jgi:hypothetical protein
MTRAWRYVSEIAEAISCALADGDEIAAVRALCDGVNRLPDARADGMLDEALADPGDRAGSVEWAALLAGCVTYRLHSIGLSAPAWAVDTSRLTRAWCPVVVSEAKWAYDLSGAPPELARLNIVWHQRNLSSPRIMRRALVDGPGPEE